MALPFLYISFDNRQLSDHVAAEQLSVLYDSADKVILNNEYVNTFFVLRQSEAPGTEPLCGMFVRWAGDAGGPDPRVDGFGKSAVLDKPP
jgi:hypothetical protein